MLLLVFIILYHQYYNMQHFKYKNIYISADLDSPFSQHVIIKWAGLMLLLYLVCFIIFMKLPLYNRLQFNMAIRNKSCDKFASNLNISSNNFLILCISKTTALPDFIVNDNFHQIIESKFLLNALLTKVWLRFYTIF